MATGGKQSCGTVQEGTGVTREDGGGTTGDVV